jgi:hypothetical protein
MLNLVLFRSATFATQSSVASLGDAVTMITSQHIILDLRYWRGVSAGAPSSVHRLRPFTPAGNGNAGAQHRSSHLSAIQVSSPAMSPSPPNNPEYVDGTFVDQSENRRVSRYGYPQSSVMKGLCSLVMSPVILLRFECKFRKK